MPPADPAVGVRVMLAVFPLLGLLLGGLAPAARAEEVRSVDQGHLVAVGEVLGGARVQRIEQHPEFERTTVALPGGAELALEVTPARPDTSPACVHHGLAVYPRFELLGGEILPEAEPATRALCERLELRGADLPIGLRQEVVEVESPTTPQAVGGEDGPGAIHLPGGGVAWARPLHAPMLVLVLCVIGALPATRRGLRDAPGRDLLAVTVIAWLARLALSPRGLQIAPDAGYEQVVLSWGIHSVHPLYGDGYTALHAPLQRLTGWDPAALFGLHLALSAVAPSLAWALGWQVLRERWAALTVGLGLALSPVALRLAGSEVAHVPLATLELLAVLAAVSHLRRPGLPAALMAGLATGLTVHLRPEALPFTLLPAGLLLARLRQAPLPSAAGLSSLVGLIVWRLLTLAAPDAQGPVHADQFLRPRFWWEAVTPPLQALTERRGAFQIFLDPRLTPALLPALALFGLLVAVRRRDRAAGLPVALALCWWAASVLPILPKAWPVMDALRLQLPGQAALLLLAGVGVRALPAGRALMPLALILLTPLHLGFVRQPWAGMVEWSHLPTAMASLPPGATVLFPDHEVHARAQAQVGAQLQRRAGHERLRWQPMSDFVAAPAPGPDLFAWVGLTCRITDLPGRLIPNDLSVNPCLQLARVCTLTPFAVTTLPDRTDVDLRLVDPPVQVGLYRIDGCGGPAAPGASASPGSPRGE